MKAVCTIVTTRRMMSQKEMQPSNNNYEQRSENLFKMKDSEIFWDNAFNHLHNFEELWWHFCFFLVTSNRADGSLFRFFSDTVLFDAADSVCKMIATLPYTVFTEFKYLYYHLLVGLIMHSTICTMIYV